MLKTINNPAIPGVEIPAGIDVNVPLTEAVPSFIADVPPPIEIPAPPAVPLITTAPRINKLFFTGRLKSGKDYAAKLSGATIFGFADPLYAIASHSFGVTVNSTEGKDIPGIREFLQTVAQWGRGVINEKYPLTVARALFMAQIRANGELGNYGCPEVQWANYGKDVDIWLNACIARANAFLAENPDARVAVTNCRFENEFKRLAAEGFVHWHCLCSANTWKTRLAVSKLTPDSPAVKDLSEKLAADLDANVIKQISAVKTGPQLRCIWSDELAAKPSARLHTVETFLKSIGGQ